MIAPSFAAGLRSIVRRPGLVGLLYGLSLALALILALPVLAVLNAEVAGTGFGPALAEGFDLVIWADFGETMLKLLAALSTQLLWMVPLWLVWKTGSTVGLIHALQGEGLRSFWQGVGRYTGRGLLLALLYIVLVVVLTVAVVFLTLFLNGVWEGEVGAFWVNFVLLPTLLISGLAVLDLMHDYSRIALVVEDQPVMQAWTTGLRWPLRHGQASWLYWLWFLPALALFVVPTLLDMALPGAAAAGIWLLFVLQQVFLFARAAVTVGWIGSETALFETIRLREAPLLAEDAVPAEDTAETPDIAPEAEPPDWELV